MADVEVGQIYEGRVSKLMDFGAFVTILPDKDGLVHISEISNERVEKVSDKLAEGDVVKVKVLEVDRQGRVRLSMKEVEAAPGNTDHHSLSNWERFRTRLLKAVFWGGVTALACFVFLSFVAPGKLHEDFPPLNVSAIVWIAVIVISILPTGGWWGNGDGWGNGGD